jgi:hypothetical protein
MSPAGFEPIIPASERPQTHDRAATGHGLHLHFKDKGTSIYPPLLYSPQKCTDFQFSYITNTYYHCLLHVSASYGPLSGRKNIQELFYVTIRLKHKHVSVNTTVLKLLKSRTCLNLKGPSSGSIAR